MIRRPLSHKPTRATSVNEGGPILKGFSDLRVFEIKQI